MEPETIWHRIPPEELLEHYQAAKAVTVSEVSFAAALAGTGKTAEAMQELYGVIEREPNNFKAFIALGAIQADMGKKEDAIRFMREAVRVAPNDVFTHWGLGSMLHKFGHAEEARVELTEVVAISSRLTAEGKQFGTEQLLAIEAQKLLEI